MLQKLLFLITLTVSSLVSLGQVVVENALPGAPVSTVASYFMRCRIVPPETSSAALCDVVLNVSEVSTASYPTCGMILRWKNDQKYFANPDSLVDLRNGGAYQFNLAGMKIRYNKDYYLFIKFDLTANPKVYSVYARMEDMKEMQILGENLQFRTVPTSSLNIYSVLYPNDTTANLLPTLRIKEFRSSAPLTYATGITVNTSTTVLNQPTALTATTVPANANAGIYWRLKTATPGATLTADGILTLTQNTPVEVEAYAVTGQGSVEVKATKVITTTTALHQIQSGDGVKLLSNFSETGIFIVDTKTLPTANESYNVYNCFGQLVKSGNVSENRINIANACKGVYFIQFKNLSKQQSVRVILQ